MRWDRSRVPHIFSQPPPALIPSHLWGSLRYQTNIPQNTQGPHLQPQQHTGYRMGSPGSHAVFSQPHIRQSQPSGMQVLSEQITHLQQGISQTTDRISSKKYPNVLLNQQRVHSSPQTDRMQEKNIDYIDIDSPTPPKISKLVSMNQQMQPNPDIEMISCNKVDPASNRLPERPARLPSANLSLPAEKDNADQSRSSWSESIHDAIKESRLAWWDWKKSGSPSDPTHATV